MAGPRRVLIAGESWVTHSIHQKGFDSFTTTAYEEGVGPLRAALEAGGYDVVYLACGAKMYPISLFWPVIAAARVVRYLYLGYGFSLVLS